MSNIICAKTLNNSNNVNSVLKEIVDKLNGLSMIKPGDLVLLKPNFVAPFPEATTDLEFIDFFIDAVRNCGGHPVVGEMSGYEFDTEQTIKILGVKSFLDSRDVKFINLEKSQYQTIELSYGMPKVEIAEIALKADFIINLPVLKGHTITKVTGATKNLFGLLSLSSRRKMHCHKLDSAIASLPGLFPRILHIMDARKCLTRAVFGESKSLGLCMGSYDALAMDQYGSKLLGVNPNSVGHLLPLKPYVINGFQFKECNQLAEKNSMKERVHRYLYFCFYYLDELKCTIFGGNSIIPHIHWSLGVHPDVSSVPLKDIYKVANLCPVEAIDVERRKVIKKKCIKVRCLCCYYNDPTGKVVLKGLNRPKHNK